MKLTFKQAIATIILMLSLAAPVSAGPFEDGIAAAKSYDWESASKLWSLFENTDDANIQFKIGELLDKGVVVPYNASIAMKWYRLAADKGHAEAQFRLAEMYHSTVIMKRSSPEDLVEAAQWYRKAAVQGHAAGQQMLGRMFYAGHGVSLDYVEAAKWYRKAADQGIADAQHDLGGLYKDGKGVAQDYAEAVKWYRLSADQGYNFAQDSLGHMYESGRGVPQDYISAYIWFNLAAAQENNPELIEKRWPGQSFTKHRELAAKHLTPVQLAEAQKLAREWKPKVLKR